MGNRILLYALLVLAGGAAACGSGEPTPTPPTAAAQEPDRPERFADELAAAEATIERLQMELEKRPPAAPAAEAGDRLTLETELLAAKATAERRGQALEAAQALVAEHRQGLDRCVEELNRVAASKRIVVGQGSGSGGGRTGRTWTTAPAPSSGSRSTTRREVRKVRTLSTPDVSIAGEDVIISARLWNPDEENQTVTIEIALLADGVVEDTETQTVLIPAHGDLAVASRHHLYGTYEGKTLAGRVLVLE